MKKQAILMAVLMILAAISLNMEVAIAVGPYDCLDACFTGCVQPDTRLMQRCEGKCQIRCSPDAETAGERGE